MWISDLRARAQEATLDFAWRQWSQLGLSAHSAGSDNSAIDPECLILFTMEVARRDPRLFDESLDWIAANRRLLSFQRLTNLARRFPVHPELLDAVTETATSSPPTSRPRHDPDQATDRRNLQPLFSPDMLAYVGEPDAIFAAHGYLRPRVTLSGKSAQPDVREPACLAFLLRLLFGPGSRSEAIRILLTFRDGQLDAARIAEEIAFAKRNVTDTLTALAAAKALTARWSGNERVFAADRLQWAEFLGMPGPADLPEFVSWTHLLPAVIRLVAWLDEAADSEDSDYLLSSSARDLAERLGPDLGAADISSPDPAQGSAFIKPFVRMVDEVITALRPTR